MSSGEKSSPLEHENKILIKAGVKRARGHFLPPSPRLGSVRLPISTLHFYHYRAAGRRVLCVLLRTSIVAWGGCRSALTNQPSISSQRNAKTRKRMETCPFGSLGAHFHFIVNLHCSRSRRSPGAVFRSFFFFFSFDVERTHRTYQLK